MTCHCENNGDYCENCSIIHEILGDGSISLLERYYMLRDLGYDDEEIILHCLQPRLTTLA
ncbi:hypothetical protein UFOVP80_4 [uncultured Caudovirales phage]|jgi:hypothetical protein|uniref:Uncharacterized protein n=1 Tax=uncultured Caudovirales phage TaxID=2100421 RepID=A0A6J5KZ02_9CAUD|nr:hypothetical protein UFOVP80_4 [uncultured Caudovirales phage]